MYRFTLALPILVALCACRSERYDDSDSYAYRKPATTNASAARNDGQTPYTSFSADDKSFIEKATMGGMFEVRTSRIAQTKNVSTPVLEFAQQMVDDHSDANRELDGIARNKGIIPPTKLDSMHEQKVDELEKLDGHAFEREYYEVQSKSHDEAIDLFERCEKKVDDPELRTFIERTLPTLRKHRQHLMENIGTK